MPSGSAPALSALASSRDKVDAWLKDSEGLERCSAGEQEREGPHFHHPHLHRLHPHP